MKECCGVTDSRYKVMGTKKSFLRYVGNKKNDTGKLG